MATANRAVRVNEADPRICANGAEAGGCRAYSTHHIALSEAGEGGVITQRIPNGNNDQR